MKKTNLTQREVFFLILLSKDIQEFTHLSASQLNEFLDHLPIILREKLKTNKSQLMKEYLHHKFKVGKSALSVMYEPYYTRNYQTSASVYAHLDSIVNEILAQLVKKRLIHHDPSPPDKWVWLSHKGYALLQETIFFSVKRDPIFSLIKQICQKLRLQLVEHHVHNYDFDVKNGPELLCHIRIERAFHILSEGIQPLLSELIEDPHQFGWYKTYQNDLINYKRLATGMEPPFLLLYTGGDPLKQLPFIQYLDAKHARPNTTIVELKRAREYLDRIGTVLFLADCEDPAGPLNDFFQDRVKKAEMA